MGFQIKRVDENQKQVVKAIRSATASVAHTHTLGNGFPDIVAGVPGLTLVGNFNRKKVLEALAKIPGLKVLQGANLMIEIKDGTKPASRRKLTPDEEKWHKDWMGQIAIVESEQDSLKLISASENEYKNMCVRAGILPDPADAPKKNEKVLDTKKKS